MKIHSESNRTSWRSAVVLIAGVFALMALANANPARANNIDEQAAFGKAYGEWSARWWQWQRSLALDGMDPVTDETGEFCAEDQLAPGNSQVWFLAGTAGAGPVERDCTVPSGTAIFFPLVNAIFFNDPPEDFTVAEKRGALGGLFELTCILQSSLDGVPTAVSDNTVRTQSPPFDDPDSGDSEAVSDGYWVMLPPLSPGAHTLEFKGALCSPGKKPNTLSVLFSVDVTYALTIE